MPIVSTSWEGVSFIGFGSKALDTAVAAEGSAQLSRNGSEGEQD